MTPTTHQPNNVLNYRPLFSHLTSFNFTYSQSSVSQSIMKLFYTISIESGASYDSHKKNDKITGYRLVSINNVHLSLKSQTLTFKHSLSSLWTELYLNIYL